MGVIGGGLIAQAVHLPNLQRLETRFDVVALADPSRVVADALSRRHRIGRVHTDWRALLDDTDLDGIIVCSPHHTHAEITLAALDLGVHVFVEKPLCLDPADADAICARQRVTGSVVQVGYMKRFDPAYESLLGSLPSDARGLRLIDGTTHDPWMAREPFVPWSEMVTGADVPDAALARARESERAQVESAVGTADPGAVAAYANTFLAALIHDVNLVHGVLERLGVQLPAQPVAAGHWNAAKAAHVVLELPGGARWHSAWALLGGLHEFREDVAFYFDDAVHRLRFPAPYFTQTPALHELSLPCNGGTRLVRRQTVRNAYVEELRHFHACVVDRAECRSPAEQGRLDVATLRDLFVLADSDPAIDRRS